MAGQGEAAGGEYFALVEGFGAGEAKIGRMAMDRGNVETTGFKSGGGEAFSGGLGPILLEEHE